MLDSDDPIKMAEYIAAADRYFRELSNPQQLFDKPYVPAATAGYNVVRLGYLLHHLGHQSFHTVLDFGAGMCWLTGVFLRCGCRVTALDVSRAALDLGGEALRLGRVPGFPDRVRLLTYDGFRIPLADASVDRVACYDALHHVPNKQTVLREIYRVLRNGGRACFVEPGPGHAASEEATSEADAWGVLEDEVDAPQLCQMAADVGFASSYIVPLPHPNDNQSTSAPYQALRDGPRRRALDWTGNDALVVLTKVCGGRRDSRSPGTLLADLTVLTAPVTVQPGELFEVVVRARNVGDTAWLALRPDAGGPAPFDYDGAFLSPDRSRKSDNTAVSVGAYRRYIEAHNLEGAVTIGATLWRVGAEGPVDVDFGRGFLAADVEPGDAAATAIRLRAPMEPGLHRLTLDAVAEYVCWFSHHGSTPAQCYFVVEGAARVADSRAPRELAAHIAVSEGEPAGTLTVTVENAGDTVWLAHALPDGGWVQLGLQAIEADTGHVQRDWRRVALPRDVLPGDVVRLRVDLRDAPPGVGAVRLDLVSELRTWFADVGSRVFDYMLRSRPAERE